MTEKSGIEILEDILQRLEMLEKKIDVIDRNIKLLANSRPSELVERPKANVAEKVQSKTESSVGGFKNFKFETQDAAKSGGDEVLAQRQRQPAKSTVVVKGKMVTEIDGKAVPLPNISAKIYDDKDVLIKETRTNRAGHWVSHLSPGKYIVLFEGEFNGKKLLPQNRNFIVPEGQNEFEVS
jgi:hypothetical protein